MIDEDVGSGSKWGSVRCGRMWVCFLQIRLEALKDSPGLLDWSERVGRKEVNMLPPFIIEQIRKREEKIRREDDERPAIRLPLEDMPPLMPEPNVEIEDDDNRGVVIIDLCSPS